MGKPMLMTPPIGNCTGINSAMVEKVRKNKKGIHILENEGMEGNKYKKRAIAATVTTPIYNLSFNVKISVPPEY